MEEPVAAAVILADTRPAAGVAYISLLHCVNDPESLERLWGEIMEHLWTLGCRRVLGPTGLSPYLEQGVLHNYFHVTPPLHTPYNPPYLPELVEGLLEPVLSSQLFHRRIPAVLPVEESQSAQLIPLDATRLAGDLLPLFAAACSPLDDLPPPDAEDVTFLLHWLRVWPLYGWLAQVEEQPVGFILMQPDLARALRRANGGRNLAWRLWLNWRSQQPARSGRLLFGAVLPEWRGQGIGGQLWRQALRTGQVHGWQSITVGPVAVDSPAAYFLTQQGAQAQQRYVLYEREL
jgi:GNAT superfamily N-acetyltransferase